MKKSDLKDGMVVVSSGGNHGVVSQDKDGSLYILWLYDWDRAKSYVLKHSQNRVTELNDFDDELNCFCVANEDEPPCYKKGDKIVLFSIVAVYELKNIWKLHTCCQCKYCAENGTPRCNHEKSIFYKKVVSFTESDCTLWEDDDREITT